MGGERTDQCKRGGEKGPVGGAGPLKDLPAPVPPRLPTLPPSHVAHWKYISSSLQGSWRNQEEILAISRCWALPVLTSLPSAGGSPGIPDLSLHWEAKLSFLLRCKGEVTMCADWMFGRRPPPGGPSSVMGLCGTWASVPLNNGVDFSPGSARSRPSPPPPLLPRHLPPSFPTTVQCLLRARGTETLRGCELCLSNPTLLFLGSSLCFPT